MSTISLRMSLLRSNRFSSLVATLAVSAAMVVLAGCGKGHFSEKGSADQQNIFRYSLVTNPTKLDPATVQDGDTIDLLQQVYEGLVQWGTDNMVKPNLAASWDITNGGKTYIFHLREDIKFSSGRPVTAEDFKFSFDRACNPALKSETVDEYMGDIVGVTDRRDHGAPDVSGVKVIDPHTLEIDLVKPEVYFLGQLTYLASAVVDKDVVKPDQEITSVDQMIGTGPFIATNYVEDQVFSLKANPNYHEGGPKIAGIERPILKDAISRLNAFKSGQVDLIQLERQDVQSLQNDPTYEHELHFYPRPATWYVAFNTKVYPPFADRRVRQAFTMAIDSNSIVDKVLGGVNTVANGILPPGVLGHRDKTAMLPYDPGAAKKLLAQAGFSDGSQMPPLKLFFRSDREDVKLVAEAVQNYLKQNLNVSVSLSPLEWTAYLNQNNQKALPFYHMRWGADYLDPQNFLSTLLATDGPENKQFYSNPEFDALCAKADAYTKADDPARLALYAKAEDIALQDAAWDPIYFQRDAELISPRVHGLRESLFGHLPHTTVTLDPVK